MAAPAPQDVLRGLHAAACEVEDPSYAERVFARVGKGLGVPGTPEGLSSQLGELGWGGLFREVVIAACEENDLAVAQAVFLKAGRRLGPGLAPTLDELARRLKELGWGELAVHRSRGVYSAALRGSLFQGFESDCPICDLYAGLLSGVAERQDKRRTVFVERRCVACGAKECLFESIGAGE